MGKGGSRFGAGRPGWRQKCEHLLALDVRVLARRGRLAPGMSYSWAWSRGGEPAGNIGIHTGSDHVRLAYTWTPYGSDPQQVECCVRLERTPCHFGGSRPWFRCPRCWALRAVIYGVASDGKFGCRRCMRLAYATEQSRESIVSTGSCTSSRRSWATTEKNQSGCAGELLIGSARSSKPR